MKFKYSARTKEGEMQVGFVEAPSREAALNILISHQLFVLSVESAEKVSWFEGFSRVFSKIKSSDLMIFTRQFATLMESKVALSNALRILYKQTKKPLLKEAIYEIANDVDAGLSLSQALERQGIIFSDFYVSMIRSAEITGRLEEAMLFLADYLEKEVMWRSRVQNALIYPVVVIILFIIVAGLMITAVFPQIEPIFRESQVSLPLVTTVFLNAGSFILKWWWAVILAILAIVFLLIDYLRSPEGKAVMDELIMKLPVLGGLFRKIFVARFTESTSVLIKGGIPITQAIEIAGAAIGNVVYRDIIHEVAEGVRAGELFSNLLIKHEEYFPPLVGQMVAVGESTGRLDEILSRISTFFTRETNTVLDNLMELIQPALIIFIGVLVGLLFASILIPIYNLAQVF